MQLLPRAPDCGQQLIRGAQPHVGSSRGSWARGTCGVEHGCCHCLSRGSWQRGEGVCHGCLVPEQGRRAGEGTCLWLLVRLWVGAAVAGAGGVRGAALPASLGEQCWPCPRALKGDAPGVGLGPRGSGDEQAVLQQPWQMGAETPAGTAGPGGSPGAVQPPLSSTAGCPALTLPIAPAVPASCLPLAPAPALLPGHCPAESARVLPAEDLLLPHL